jgi:hypothetical protein
MKYKPAHYSSDFIIIVGKNATTNNCQKEPNIGIHPPGSASPISIEKSKGAYLKSDRQD